MNQGKEKRTRQPTSKYLCGMLNSGKGGTIYCGVTDDGTVTGFMMSPFQRQHCLLSIADTFSRWGRKTIESSL